MELGRVRQLLGTSQACPAGLCCWNSCQDGPGWEWDCQGQPELCLCPEPVSFHCPCWIPPAGSASRSSGPSTAPLGASPSSSGVCASSEGDDGFFLLGQGGSGCPQCPGLGSCREHTLCPRFELFKEAKLSILHIPWMVRPNLPLLSTRILLLL